MLQVEYPDLNPDAVYHRIEAAPDLAAAVDQVDRSSVSVDHN